MRVKNNKDIRDMIIKTIGNWAIVVCLLFTPLCAWARGLVNLGGTSVDYKEITASSNTVIFAWTTWCPYCVKELKKLLSGSVPLDNVALYFVNIGERDSVVQRFVKAQNVPESMRDKIILDPAGTIADRFSITGIPVYIFLKDGQAVHRSFYMDRQTLERVFKTSE